MAKSLLVAIAVLLPLSVCAQATGTRNAGPGTVLTGEDSIIPAQTSIVVHTREAIAAATDDERMYQSTVDRDVADTKGRVMIPKGSDARILIQRTGASLSLDLASVTVAGQTYSLIASNATPDTAAGSTQGAQINVPAETVLTFRLDNPLMLLVPVK